jgi:3-oxoacyl-[acyl-carrier-protein] synthase III
MRTPDTYLRSVGVYLPAMVGLRTAIAQGRYPADEAEYLRLGGAAVAADVPAPELAIRAARHAFERARMLSPADLDLMLAVLTCEHHAAADWQPRHYLQQYLTGEDVPTIEVRDGCCGMFSALEMAAGYLQAAPARRSALLVGADSRSADSHDTHSLGAGSRPVPGDAGCALLVTRDGGFATVLALNAAAPDATARSEQSLHDLVDRTLLEADVCAADVAKVAFPHGRRHDPASKAVARLGLTMADTTWEYGASIGHLGVSDQFLALDHLLTTGALRAGDHVLLIGHGAAYTAVLRMRDVPAEYTTRLRCGLAGPGLIADPLQVRRRSGYHRHRDDFRLVVTMPFCDKSREFLVTIGRELELDHPLLGPLQRLIPPVGRGNGAGYLGTRRQPRGDRGTGQLHRLRARVGGRLYLQVSDGTVISSHST